MIFTRVSSSLGKNALLDIAAELSILLLRPSAISSKKQLELAFYLANKSFGTGHSIAKKFHLEFLLWLAGCKDIRKAFAETTFTDAKDILVISFARGTKKQVIGQILDSLSSNEKKFSLSDEVEPLVLEKISLSRV
ncbi:MAG: hypothetical protein AABW86_04570 [Candidatus Micrarchaeota archaeon]